MKDPRVGELKAVLRTIPDFAPLRSVVQFHCGACGSNELAGVSEKPQLPKDVEQARYEAMGVIAGLIDSARTMRPPAGTSVGDALNTWAEMCDRAAADTYGDQWKRFRQQIQNIQKAGTN